MTIRPTKGWAGVLALLVALGSPASLHAQIGVGTWVRQAAPSQPGMTMTVEACCHGGRRLTYHVDLNGTKSVLVAESPFDGSEVPILVDGKPGGQTISITRVDDHHLSSVMKVNGQVFGKSTATLSANGKTLTVVNEFPSAAGQQAVKTTEVWVKQ